MPAFNQIEDRRLRAKIIDFAEYIDAVSTAQRPYSKKKMDNFEESIKARFARYIRRRRKEISGEVDDLDIKKGAVKKAFEFDETNIIATFDRNVQRAFGEAKHTIERSLGEELSAKGAFSVFALLGLTNQRFKVSEEIKVPGLSRLNNQGRIFSIGIIEYLVMLVRNAQADWNRKLNRTAAFLMRVDLVRISPEPSWLGPKADEVCNRWRDKIVSLTGLTEGFPPLEDALSEKPPLFHPNCRHTMIPLTREEQSVALQTGAKTYRALKRRIS